MAGSTDTRPARGEFLEAVMSPKRVVSFVPDLRPVAAAAALSLLFARWPFASIAQFKIDRAMNALPERLDTGVGVPIELDRL
jgi:hypothetical protein